MSKPIELTDFVEAIKDLSDENLQSVKSQLENLLAKLKETNQILEQETENAENNQDKAFYKETIKENEQVIESQNQRLASLTNELKKRGYNDDNHEGGVYL